MRYGNECCFGTSSPRTNPAVPCRDPYMIHPAPKSVRYVCEEKRRWIRTLPCLLATEEPCKCGGFINPATRGFVTECAHVRSKGSGGDDTLMIPLCQHHHTGRGDSQHMIPRQDFERLHAEALNGQTLVQIGKQLHREWLRIAGVCSSLDQT